MGRPTLAAAGKPEERERGVYARVLACVVGEIELREDAAYVRLDRLARYEQRLGDAAIGLALCDQREHLPRDRVEALDGQLHVDRLDRPTSVAVGPDGALYVTNHGLSVGGGEVLRIE